MAIDGHAPTNGPANALYLLGQHKCPNCRNDLHPAGNSGYSCVECDRHYPVAGGAP